MEWSKLLVPQRIRQGKRMASRSDLRSEFEKDYHRIIGSASFRRLQDKTQVFPLDKSDFIRTRLTHSLEVSSFARSLGQTVSQRILEIGKEGFLPHHQRDICDILQCAGLIHDIGNPPFGHFGEEVIRDWFTDNLPQLTYKGKPLTEVLTPQMQADFCNFEGNTQALRVVSKLHYLIDENGMNLTIPLLGTIIKYPVSSLEIDKNSGDIRTKKMGYYYAERDVFSAIQSALGTNGKRHPLAFLLEAADDIAYKTADIEDAYKKGCINFEQLVRELSIRGDGMDFNSYYMRLVNKLLDLRDRAAQNGFHNPEINAVQNWIVYVQGCLLNLATDNFMRNYDAIMAGEFKGELLAQGDGALLAKALGDIAYDYAFVSEPIYKIEIAAESTMSFLLERFVKAAIVYETGERITSVQSKLMDIISDNYLSIYHIFSKDADEAEKLYLRLLLITDSICGMTDSYAKRLHQELSGMIL